MIFGLAALATLTSCSHDIEQVTSVHGIMSARVETVQVEKLPRQIDVRGTIAAEHDAVLTSRAIGPVVGKHVKIGDAVRRGQLLVEIESDMSGGGLAQATGALAQAQASLALSERNYRRFESLYAKKACSELELDMARMQFEQSRGAVEQAQGAVNAASAVAGESSLRAPFDAMVVDILVSVGDMVAAGRPVIHLQSSEGRELQFTVRAGDRRFVRSGDRIPFTVESQAELGVQYATITEVAPAADPTTHSFAAKAALANHALPAGLTAQMTLLGDSTEMILVSNDTVYRTGGLTLVSTVDESGKTRTRAVSLGQRFGERVEVLSGLRAGERVVANRTGVIPEGTRIERVNG